jgi:hypothetical protein
MLAAVKHLAWLFQGIFLPNGTRSLAKKRAEKNAGHKDKRLSNMIWHNSTPDYEFPDPPTPSLPRNAADHCLG